MLVYFEISSTSLMRFFNCHLGLFQSSSLAFNSFKILFLVVAYNFLENSLNPILTFDLCFISLIAILSSSFERINDFFLFMFILSPHFLMIFSKHTLYILLSC